MIYSNTLENDKDTSEHNSTMCLPESINTENISEKTVEMVEMTNIVVPENLNSHNKNARKKLALSSF